MSSLLPKTVVPLSAAMFALALSSAAFLAVGVDPLTAYSAMSRALLTVNGLAESVARGIPLMIVAVGLILPLRMKFWNIGGEGQIYMGAFAAALIVQAAGSSGAYWMIPVMIFSAFLCGAAWGVIPALLKSKLGVNEILVTLMMNFVAILWVDYLVYGPWTDPEGRGFPLTAMFPLEARLPAIPGTRIHAAIILGVAAAIAAFIILRRTKFGFEIRVTGDSTEAAEYAGINTTKLTVLAMVFSGGLAGIAGMGIASGILFRLRPGLSPGYGFTAIIVAFLAGLNPWIIIPASILFGALLVGGDILQSSLNLSFSVVLIFQALILILVLVARAFVERGGRLRTWLKTS